MTLAAVYAYSNIMVPSGLLAGILSGSVYEHEPSHISARLRKIVQLDILGAGF